MEQFQNILVGVDITRLEQPDSVNFSRPVEEAIHRGLWLAEKTGAQLTFLAVLDGSEHGFEVLSDGDQKQVLQAMHTAARRALNLLVERAKAVSVNARAVVRLGKAAVEIIRQVLDEHHDLVIVGTRDLRTIQRLLVGSTAMKLLRKCPSTVWVTKPTPASCEALMEIAVASDFSPVADRALQAALSLAKQTGARIHLINSVDFPLDRTWTTGLPDAVMDQYHQKLRTRAADGLQHQLSLVETRDPVVSIETQILDGSLNTDAAILRFVDECRIDLLAIGIIGRSGIAGVLVGNTAERLLPQLTCSVLAVKPVDFDSPITVATLS
ncbi:MAG: universal stress protein [Planctomycetes bacterium]|nr:universal stress protein [Planctomycetota bacterium]